jgi:hypothetical protein
MEVKDKSFLNPKVLRIAVIKGIEDKKKALFIRENEQGQESLKLEGKEYFQVVPTIKKNQNERLYIAGPSGSGKSTYVADYIAQHIKLINPDVTIYIFSSVKYDKLLDERFGDRIVRVDMDNEDCFNDPFDPEEFETGAIVLFDDVDKIKLPKVRVSIFMLRENLLETSRHYGLTIISTSHQLSNYARTRTLLNEATSVTFFPKHAGGLHYIKNYLQKHMGFNQVEIKRCLMLSKNSRWISVYRSHPKYVISAKESYLIKDEF